MNNLEKKIDYSKDVEKVFNILSIEGKYKVVGSNSLQSTLYGSDYDLNEIIDWDGNKKILLDKLYQLFKKKYIFCKNNDNYFIIDLKNGLDSNGDDLHWNHNEVIEGFKTLKNGNLISFQEALNQHAMLKLDMIVLIKGIYTEFSEVYFLNINDKKNYNSKENNKSIEKLLQIDINNFLKEQNYWKTLKRIFSLIKLKNDKDPILDEMINFFNSKIGLINKCKNEIDILILILENTFKKPKIKDIIFNLKVIKNWSIKAGLNINYDIDIILKIIKLKEKSLYKSLIKLQKKLNKIINEESYLFLTKKNLI